MQRLRLTFAKTALMRYTGHLDLHSVWERTFRRAQLPLAYSQGFHPQPRLQLAAALPLGFTSDCEIADAWMEAPQDLAQAEAAVTAAVPPGLKVLAVAEAPLNAPALQTQVCAAVYTVRLPAEAAPAIAERVAALAERVAALLAQPALPRTRRDKAYDLRPLIEALAAEAPGLTMRLTAREGATGRPEEVVEALGLDPTTARYHRAQLLLAE